MQVPDRPKLRFVSHGWQNVGHDYPPCSLEPSMPPIVTTDDPQTMWDHFLRSWPIFAGIAGFLLAAVALLSRLVFGHIVTELQMNTAELKLTRKELADLKERLSRIEGYLDASGKD